MILAAASGNEADTERATVVSLRVFRAAKGAAMRCMSRCIGVMVVSVALAMGMVALAEATGGYSPGLFYSSVAKGNVLGGCVGNVPYFDGGPGDVLAGKVEVIKPKLSDGCPPLHADLTDVEAGSAALQSSGALRAYVIAGGISSNSFGTATAELFTQMLYGSKLVEAGLPDPVEHGTLHVDEDLVITGTASLGTKWYACIEVLLPTGKVPDGGCLLVNHFGDGSPVSQTLHLGFDLATSFGLPLFQIGWTPGADIQPIVLHVLLTVEAHGGGVTSGNQLLYNRIDLSKTAYIRQTLPPDWTFASSSGFLSESPFNSPDPNVPVPEPSSFALLGGGLALLACLRRSAWRRLSSFWC